MLVQKLYCLFDLNRSLIFSLGSILSDGLENATSLSSLEGFLNKSKPILFDQNVDSSIGCLS